ncbi:MAG: tRNA dihydrouridine synthase DusB [Gemmatimonadetes bacterium]|jgi:nifR3 family TIM-barrel protein|nr:tRNA dihydrouridine synthase DusB [Gemmatimonadota bacterium]MEE2847800.1 tRNA dihydrouridine synthase DusB [Gemmatimonadota bacterium]HAC06348.1 tRNA dihydrouridine synthase DusB [Gemmatimonadota bacterium]HIC53220.1 tRNA dihydrouridine synthase DusB [Gemmatimonadota bacterium]
MSTDVIALLSGSHTPLYLAPQAGVSESPFRRLCRRYGADVVVSEFVSAAGIVMQSPRSRDYLRFDEEERPIGIQIFGADPAMMRDAAAFVADTYSPDFIDINFGCPVKKVVKRNGGSGCLKDLDLLETLVRAVDDATSLPTTVKIRSGFDERTRDPVTIGLRCQDAGARALCIHPRTRADMYSGEARWDEIRAVTEALEIPVIGNGDIRTGDDARRMRDETGCAGIMIARGSHGDPWLFSQARAALDGDPVPSDPSVEERFEICLDHAKNAIAFERNPERAIIDFRKHLGWYTKGLPDGRLLRTELFQANKLEDVEVLLEGYLAGHRAEALV